MVQRLATLTLALCLLSGCDTKIYTQFCTTDKTLPISCLRIDSAQHDVNALLHTLLNDMNLSDSCTFVLRGIHYEVDACNNPLVHAIGGDFDGYVRLQLFHEGSCYYRTQQDFKSAPWQQKMQELVQSIKTDLQLQAATY